MNKLCGYENCTNKPTTACRCSESINYLCEKHLSSHIIINRAHTLESLLTSINITETQEILTQAQDLLIKLSNLKNDAINLTTKLISFFQSELQRLLDSFTKLEYQIETVQRSAILQSPVYKSDYESIKSLKIHQIQTYSSSYQDLSTSFTKVLSQEIFTTKFNCTDVIFSKSQKLGGLWAINVDDFKLRQLDFSPKIGICGGSCKIDDSRYFFNGGCKVQPVGDTYIIDMKNKTYETLPPSPPRFLSACICKDNKVYVFGGHEGNVYISTCQIYLISERVWINIQNLPQPFGHNTASIMNNVIVLTGNQTEKVYSYDDVEFVSIMTLQANTYKIICEKWIVTPTKLYENKSKVGFEWESCHISWISCNLWVFNTFRKDNFIYFICANAELWRVNINAKKVEKVSYS